MVIFLIFFFNYLQDILLVNFENSVIEDSPNLQITATIHSKLLCCKNALQLVQIICGSKIYKGKKPPTVWFITNNATWVSDTLSATNKVCKNENLCTINGPKKWILKLIISYRSLPKIYLV